MKKNYDVVILGAGFGGLGMGAQLLKNHINDFVILEKAPTFGGVWRDNIYPGAACDIAAPLYSYSHFPNYEISQMYVGQHEIIDYMSRYIDAHQLEEKIQYEATITNVNWNETRQLWEITINHQEQITCRAFIPAWGQLNEPNIPDFKGLEQFKGDYFHSGAWPKQIDLKNKVVISVGNAASAVQYIPEVAKQVKKLSVFQRSANWVVPRLQKDFTTEEKQAFQKGSAQYWRLREEIFNRHEEGFARARVDSQEQKDSKIIALDHLFEQVPDEELREKLIPDYDLGCKRILRSDDYYPTLMQDHVSLVTAGIDYFTKEGIVDAEGKEHKADVIIFGTGFVFQNFQGDLEIQGVNNIKLSEQWGSTASAYLGITVPNFPNLFMLYGPNTNLNHNSILAMMEIQQEYIVQAIQVILQENKVLQVKDQVCEVFNDTIQKEMENLTFSSNCFSWYKNAEGKVVNNWSSTVRDYQQQTQFNLDDFYAAHELNQEVA